MPNITNVLILKGYKYLLTEELEIMTPFIGYKIQIKTGDKLYAEISETGLLKINEGYAWDGMTGYREHKKTILPSLIHDVLYQFIAMDDSPVPHADSGKTRKHYVKLADKYFMRLLKANKVGTAKRKLIKFAIKFASAKTKFSADPIEIDYTNLFEI